MNNAGTSNSPLGKLFSIIIVIGGLIMIFLADRVTEFLKKNRMFEVLGLFILFIVGVMLLSEGGHLAHMHLFESAITPMSKTTFYFVIFVLILIDIVQNKYKNNLNNVIGGYELTCVAGPNE